MAQVVGGILFALFVIWVVLGDVIRDDTAYNDYLEERISLFQENQIKITPRPIGFPEESSSVVYVDKEGKTRFKKGWVHYIGRVSDSYNVTKTLGKNLVVPKGYDRLNLEWTNRKHQMDWADVPTITIRNCPDATARMLYPATADPHLNKRYMEHEGNYDHSMTILVTSTLAKPHVCRLDLENLRVNEAIKGKGNTFTYREGTFYPHGLTLRVVLNLEFDPPFIEHALGMPNER